MNFPDPSDGDTAAASCPRRRTHLIRALVYHFGGRRVGRPLLPIPEPAAGRGSDRGREDAFRDEAPAECNAERIVDVQHGDSHTADRGAAAEKGTVPVEVPAPLMTARVEERREFT